MKQLLLIILTVLLGQTVSAGVEIQSFYFNPESRTISEESNTRLEEFITTMKEYEFQVIEVNGFAISGQNSEENTKLALTYIGSILSRIEISDNENYAVNNYGGNMINLSFKPESWDRVDIYYYVGREINIKPDVLITETADIDTNRSIDFAQKEPMERELIAMNDPIVMPIKFVGGKSRVQKDSYDYMEYLKNTLVENPELFAHIRGHVCCGNKPIQSWKRARVVYKYLVKQGVDKKRLSYKGYSNKQPLVYPEITQSDRSANRRVDVIFTNYKARKHKL